MSFCSPAQIVKTSDGIQAGGKGRARQSLGRPERSTRRRADIHLEETCPNPAGAQLWFGLCEDGIKGGATGRTNKEEEEQGPSADNRNTQTEW